MQGSNPAKFMKDSYDIVYTDETTTTWKLYQEIPCALQDIPIVVDNITEYYNSPGIIQQSLDDANSMVIDVVPDILLNNTVTEEEIGDENNNITNIRRKLQQQNNNGGINFEKYGNKLAWAVTDDFAVLKIEGFLQFTEQNLFTIWQNITTVATEKNVTRLIIDVINNGGGYVNLGYYLAQLLYPEATWEQLSNPYDQLDIGIYEYYQAELMPGLRNFTAEIKFYQSNLTDLANEYPDNLAKSLNASSAYFHAMKTIMDVSAVQNGEYNFFSVCAFIKEWGAETRS